MIASTNKIKPIFDVVKLIFSFEWLHWKQMATVGSQRDSQENYPRNNVSRETNVAGVNEEYDFQVSE